MAALDFLPTFIAREDNSDILKARWYIVTAVALTSACAGEHVGELYRLATKGLSLDDSKIVQRRIKEAILKGAMMYGVPKASEGFASLFKLLADHEIDDFAPRTEEYNTPGDAERREARGRKYFEGLWGAQGAQALRQRGLKYHADNWLLSVQIHYELWMSEDAVLSDIETQMCNVALLTCNNTPVQAVWHARGLLRHGGSREEARFAQEIGLAVAERFGAKTGEVTKVDDLEDV